MIQQIEFTLPQKPRGFNLVTREISEILSKEVTLPNKGMLNLFVKHCSCGICISENYDPDVRHDLALIFNKLAIENDPNYLHVLEGSDDMPSHAKSILTGTDINIPITGHRLNLGTWQGIYLCEFRNHGGPRKIVATVME